jgi:hypothetical protein
VEDQHGIFVHADLDLIDLLAAQRLSAIDAGYLTDKDRVERAYRNGHSRSFAFYQDRRKRCIITTRPSRRPLRVLLRMTYVINGIRKPSS